MRRQRAGAVVDPAAWRHQHQLLQAEVLHGARGRANVGGLLATDQDDAGFCHDPSYQGRAGRALRAPRTGIPRSRDSSLGTRLPVPRVLAWAHDSPVLLQAPRRPAPSARAEPHPGLPGADVRAHPATGERGRDAHHQRPCDGTHLRLGRPHGATAERRSARLPLRHALVEVRRRLDGRPHARPDRATGGRSQGHSRDVALLRRLHHQPRPGGLPGRRLPPRPPPGRRGHPDRTRRAAARHRPPSVRLEERQVGLRAVLHEPGTSPASGSGTVTTCAANRSPRSASADVGSGPGPADARRTGAVLSGRRPFKSLAFRGLRSSGELP